MRSQPRTMFAMRKGAFTLVELLVSMVVLLLLVAMIAQLFNSAVSVTTMGNKGIDADAQARVIFDRMAVDFARMVKRLDVDYYLKQPSINQAGNDQMAFYSEVPGYFPSSGAQSPVSLVGYRVNAKTNAANFGKVERLGKGLVWNGVSPTDSPVLFLPVPIATALSDPLPSPMPSPAPTPGWAQAGNSDPDPHGDYELLGPQVFRLEYYYLLKGQSAAGVSYASILSDTPWDVRIPNHAAIAGMRDVAAIVVAIAVIDPQSHLLGSNAQFNTLATSLVDFTAPALPGALEAKWQAAIDAGVPQVPAAVTKWVRIYHHYFYLNLP